MIRRLNERLAHVRASVDAWAGRAPSKVRLAASVVGPIGLFLLILGGVAIDDPAGFTIFGVVTVLILWFLARAGVINTLRTFASANMRLTSMLTLVIVLVFPLTQLADPVWIRVAALGATFAALAIGLNIVVGRAGLLDLGYAAFFGIGAYTAAMLSECERCPVSFHIPWFAALVASGVVGAMFGVLLGFPVLRLRGDYLAIVTLGFGEIVRISLNNLDEVPGLGINLTNGPNGLFGVVNPKVGPIDLGAPVSILGREVPSVINYYYVTILFILLVMFVVRRVDRSRIGRAWTAIREDEQAAQAMGINTTVTKLLAFASGAFFGGVAGNIFVHFQGGTSPEDFSFLVSVTVLAMVVLGGMGNSVGVVIGAVLLIAIPEKLRFVHDYRFLILGAVLMVMMRFRPEGLLPERRRRLELSERPAEAEAIQ
jgi:branched-chain amino acid transport system permease protein